MSDLFFSQQELVNLTGEKNVKRQIEWLKNNGYRFITNNASRPVVFKNQVNENNEKDGLLTRRQIANRALPIKQICGVYFLLSGSEVVYVGKSINLIERIGNHLRNGQIYFDSYSFIEACESELLELECAYIAKLTPKYNKVNAVKDLNLTLCGEPIIP